MKTGSIISDVNEASADKASYDCVITCWPGTGTKNTVKKVLTISTKNARNPGQPLEDRAVKVRLGIQAGKCDLDSYKLIK